MTRLRLVESAMKNELATPAPWVAPLGDYISWLGAAKKSANTVKLWGYHLRRFATDTGLAPFEVTLTELVRFLDGLRQRSANYQRSYRTTLRSFYQWAWLTDRMGFDPSAKLPTIGAPIGKPRPSSEEAVRFGLATTDARVRLMIMLGAQAGLRCCEIAKVHTDDLRRDLVGWSLLVHGKGRKERIIPLTDALAAALLRVDPGWVFPGRIDGHLSAGYVSKLISRALPAETTAHPLRHRFASRLYAGTGNNIRAVQDALGHASVATTQIYTAVEENVIRDGLRAVA